MGEKKKEALVKFNKENIMEAAERLFLKKGVQATTVDDIVKEADCSKSTLYVYFQSKDEIYSHIILKSMYKLLASMRESLDQSNLPAKKGFFQMCRVLVDFQKQYPLYFDSILGEISVDTDDFDKYPILYEIYLKGEEINQLITNYMIRGMDRKEIRSDIDPLSTTFILWAGICGVISMASKKEAYITMGMCKSREDFLQQGFELLYHGIMPYEAGLEKE